MYFFLIGLLQASPKRNKSIWDGEGFPEIWSRSLFFLLYSQYHLNSFPFHLYRSSQDIRWSIAKYGGLFLELALS